MKQNNMMMKQSNRTISYHLCSQIKILVVSHSTYYLGLQEMIVWGGGIKCTFK
jgi:hypothetical protein